ncbi:hypothetical protein F7725_026747 [Dissostichus mawsoni]|uniref:Uncharacterized protein n=1 Tax=Dissostichus mawsoni TaxID=36200 RepID=A0A7J5X7X6_DISMA|nr:hypothetical protein F7725_026747 [Dissostichus mawsoni]
MYLSAELHQQLGSVGAVGGQAAHSCAEPDVGLVERPALPAAARHISLTRVLMSVKPRDSRPAARLQLEPLQQGQGSHHHGPGQQHLGCSSHPPQRHHPVMRVLEGRRLLAEEAPRGSLSGNWTASGTIFRSLRPNGPTKSSNSSSPVSFSSSSTSSMSQSSYLRDPHSQNIRVAGQILAEHGLHGLLIQVHLQLFVQVEVVEGAGVLLLLERRDLPP